MSFSTKILKFLKTNPFIKDLIFNTIITGLLLKIINIFLLALNLEALNFKYCLFIFFLISCLFLSKNISKGLKFMYFLILNTKSVQNIIILTFYIEKFIYGSFELLTVIYFLMILLFAVLKITNLIIVQISISFFLLYLSLYFKIRTFILNPTIFLGEPSGKKLFFDDFFFKVQTDLKKDEFYLKKYIPLKFTHVRKFHSSRVLLNPKDTISGINKLLELLEQNPVRGKRLGAGLIVGVAAAGATFCLFDEHQFNRNQGGALNLMKAQREADVEAERQKLNLKLLFQTKVKLIENSTTAELQEFNNQRSHLITQEFHKNKAGKFSEEYMRRKSLQDIERFNSSRK